MFTWIIINVKLDLNDNTGLNFYQVLHDSSYDEQPDTLFDNVIEQSESVEEYVTNNEEKVIDMGHTSANDDENTNSITPSHHDSHNFPGWILYSINSLKFKCLNYYKLMIIIY